MAGRRGVLPFVAKHTSMKNDSISFKLLALVIIAGVIAAFLDSSNAPQPVAKTAALVSTATQPSE